MEPSQEHSCASSGEPRRRAESWRSAAASSARWIGSRRAQSRSSAVERAIWLADAAYSEAFRRKARDGRRAGTRVCACLLTCCGARNSFLVRVSPLVAPFFERGPESALRAGPRTMSGEASDAEIQEFLARAGARDFCARPPHQQPCRSAPRRGGGGETTRRGCARERGSARPAAKTPRPRRPRRR